MKRRAGGRGPQVAGYDEFDGIASIVPHDPDAGPSRMEQSPNILSPGESEGPSRTTLDVVLDELSDDDLTGENLWASRFTPRLSALDDLDAGGTIVEV